MTYPGKEIGKLGFGMMRLPRKGEEINIEETKDLVDRYLEAGYNYFDTAWAYNGSEEAVRKALVERYPRESYYLATKLAAWSGCSTKEEAEAQLATSLERTGAGYFDFYLLHNLGKGRTEAYDRFDIWDFVQKKKEEGILRHVGISAHTSPEDLDRILELHPEIEFVQLQVNYADWENPSIQSRACYETAKAHGKSVIIMEPVKGGMLADPHESVKAVLKAAHPDWTPASWAIRFAASLEGVITVLSGMSSMEQLEDNLASLRDFHGLTGEEYKVIEEARAAIDRVPIIACTRCDYCAKVCPAEIGISALFRAENEMITFNHLGQAKFHLSMSLKDKKPASACLGCGSCEEVCPQQLPIRELLKQTAAHFG